MDKIITRDDILSLYEEFENWADRQEQRLFVAIILLEAMIQATIRTYDKNDSWETPKAQKELGAMTRSIHKIIGGIYGK